MTTPESTPPSPDVEIPPSVGGAGISAVAGLFVGRQGAGVVLHGVLPSANALLIPVGMLVSVAILLMVMLAARRRMGAPASASSVKRQWLVMAGAVAVGALIGVISAL